MTLTDDPNDPRLTHGVDSTPGPQADVYLVPPAEEAPRFVRPVRRTYVHQKCGAETRMGLRLAEAYARDPRFYGATYCVNCRMHRPVGAEGEFVWNDGSKVGT